MISTIFFDIGRVLVGFDHQLIWQRLESFSPFSAKTLQHRIQDSKLITFFEMGKICSADFFHQLQQHAHLDPSLSYETFTQLWSDIFWEHQPIMELATTLRQQYTIGLLSNTDELHWNWLIKCFPIFSEVDTKILSFQVGYMKPAAEIYQKAIAQAHSSAEQCVYIDDIATYVEASRQLGIHGIHYQSSGQLYPELHKLGISW